jgi:N-methylhydantoinase A
VEARQLDDWESADRDREITLGIDTGGTFTDLVGLEGGRIIRHVKVPSTPAVPISAFVRALGEAALDAPMRRLVHGTTVATNAVLQREGARTCLLTTAGFEDVAFIQRLNRRYAFNLDWRKPTPLVARRRVLGVAERLTATGAVVETLEQAECERVAELVAALVEHDGVESVAICLLFSYLNPAHEVRLAEQIKMRLPALPVSLSSDVSPLWREYERVSTTLADAYVRPIMSNYLQALDAESSRYNSVPALVLKSNGGTATPATIATRPITTLLSGLAGGLVGGAYFGRRTGRDRCITFDMGGTSTDLGVVNNGEAKQLIEYEIEWGLPVVIPVVDVHTIGAGGGSIARLDDGGLLQVGPQSAGADPGPICYDLGGTAPTVTDADLLLGRLNGDYFLGGLIRLRPDRLAATFQAMAEALRLESPEAAACAVVHIANENMANAIRLVTIERGIDPREYSLVAFGGAGPLHACGVADAVGIRHIVVPPLPGLCSAFGATIAPLRVDRIWSVGARLEQLDEAELVRRIEDETRSALSEIERDGLARRCITERSAACRYAGQNYEHDVAVTELDSGFTGRIGEAFHTLHHRAFGYSFPHEPVELVHIRLSVREVTDPDLVIEPAGAGPVPAASLARPVFDDSATEVPCMILRSRQVAQRLNGPILIEEPDSTIYVPSGWTLSAGAAGCLQLTRNEA